MYKSLVAQSLHYFSRPHERVRRHALDVEAAWKGAELRSNGGWRVRLDAGELRELERAVDLARRRKKALGELTRADFPLPTLAPRIGDWRRELVSGRGFVLVSGAPIGNWSDAEREIFFWCLGQHIGIPGAQNPSGDLLGHVIDTGATMDDPSVRAYRTNSDIAFHCDAADVVGLLCLTQAKRGGASRIVSSVTVFNEIVRRRPDLVGELFRPFLLDTKGEGGVDYFPIPPCRYAEGTLRTFYHADYFRSVCRNAGLPPLSPLRTELLDTYDRIATSPELYLDMDFEPGDVQLLSNHVILHARTAYEDHPHEKRHLLRLWLSMRGRHSAKHRVLKGISALGLAKNLIAQKARRRVRLNTLGTNSGRPTRL